MLQVVDSAPLGTEREGRHVLILCATGFPSVGPTTKQGEVDWVFSVYRSFLSA